MSWFTRRPKWEIHFERGMAAGSQGQLQEAAAHFRKAIKSSPGEPYPHYQLGYTLSLLAKYDEALVELRETNRLRLGFFIVETEIYLCEEMIAGRIGELTLRQLRALQHLTDEGMSASAQSVSIAEQVTERAPECALGHFYLGKALMQSNPKRSESAPRRCVELGPDDSTAINALFHLAVHRDGAGDTESARQIRLDARRTYQGHPHAGFLG